MKVITHFYVDSIYKVTHVTDFVNIGGDPSIPNQRDMIVNYIRGKNLFIVSEQCEFPPDPFFETNRVDLDATHIQYLSSKRLPVHNPVGGYRFPSGGIGVNPNEDL